MLMKQNVNNNVSKDSSSSKTRNDSLFISSEIILSCADFVQYKYTLHFIFIVTSLQSNSKRADARQALEGVGDQALGFAT